MVQLEHSLGPARDRSRPPAVCSVGVFDGVHRGHQRLLSATVAVARELGAVAAVVTFEPHPRAVLDAASAPPELTTLDEKRERLAALGVDIVVVVNFTREVSEWSAEQFCLRLYERFELWRLVVGPGFALGHDRHGDADYLRGFGAGHGFDVVEVEPVTEGGRPISSSRVRAALLSGEVEEAGRLLGAPYFMDGTVERGSAVGRRLGSRPPTWGWPPASACPSSASTAAGCG